MKRSRRKFTPEFKALVSLEAIKEQHTLAELSQRFEVSPVMISRWKKEFAENMYKAFENGNQPQSRDVDTESCILKSAS